MSQQSIVTVTRRLAPVLFFLLLALVATRPLATDLGGRTLAGPDPLIDLWTVHWLTGHATAPRELFGGNIFHPDPNAVLYSDLSMGTAVLLLPFRLFVRDPVRLYNLGVLLALAFAGWAFQLLAFELTGNRFAGVLAGTLAAFASHQMSHIYHLNLLTTGWLALLLLGLHRLARHPGPGPVLLAAVSFALSAQSSGYYAVAATILPLVFAAAHWRDFRSRRVLAAAGAAALLGAALLAPYARAFMALRAREALRRPPQMSARMAFDPGRDFTSYGYVYGAVLGSEGERLFPGLLTLGLAAVALVRRRPEAAFYGVAALLFVVVSLGPKLELAGLTLSLPYQWLFALPPLDNMRHPYTFAAVATFLMAVLAASGWVSLPLAAKPWAGPAVVALAVLETLAPPPTMHRYAGTLPPAYRAVEGLPPGPILEIPVSAPETLLWAARHGWPVANGIGAFSPRLSAVLERYVQNHWIRRTPTDADDSAPAWLLAESFDVRYVIVPAGRRPAFRRLAAALDRSRAFVPVAEAEDGDRVYEFRKENVRLTDPGERREEPGEVLGEDRQPVGHQQ